jgi:hypothetical protein
MKALTKITGLVLLVIAMASCRKTEFADVPSPAYIRVFNCLDRQVTLDNKDAPQPFLTMLIDPVFDENGIPVSAATVGDFLDVRDIWARPYPDAANTSLYQKEFPGALKVVAAPILNGYDLSSWAQITSGSKRISFYTRPMNTTPFFSLDKGLRGAVLLDTTISIQEREVYTMHVLEKDYATRRSMLYVRNETFVKQPLSDSIVYVNFYNLSSDGFFQQSPGMTSGGARINKIVDTANVFVTLRKQANAATTNANMAIPGYTAMPFGTMIRNLDGKATRYYNFPLYADTSSNRIFPGNTAQMIEFYRPGLIPGNSPLGPNNLQGNYISVRVGPTNSTGGLDVSTPIMADVRSGLIITERSGIYNPRYFATVNTVEYINSKIFITTIQRKFAPPIY